MGRRSTWLGGYVTYARSLTDAPLLFHVGAGLVALAGAVGSQVAWKGGGGRENWPNLYLLLLAPSGSYRKSTSVDLACSLLSRACPGTIMDNEFSPERFIRNLAEHPTAVLKEAEFSSLLERMKTNYSIGLKNRLTELYDCVPEYSRHITGEGGRQGERLRIARPALSIIGASTTDWLVASITEMDLRSGFLPRFLLFPCEQKEPEPPGGYWAEPDHVEEGALVRGLATIAHLGRHGTMRVSFAVVREQLMAWDTRTQAVEQTPELQGLYSRLGHSAAKVCALLAVSDGDDQEGRFDITPDQCERACALLEWVIARSEATFEQHLVFSKFERLAQKALSLTSEEGTDKRFLLRRLKLSSRDLEGVLSTLKERGEIDIEQVQTGGRFRTVVTRLPTEGVTEVTKGDGFGDRSWANGHQPELPTDLPPTGASRDDRTGGSLSP